MDASRGWEWTQVPADVEPLQPSAAIDCMTLDCVAAQLILPFCSSLPF